MEKKIVEIISEENKKAPLTDEEIAELVYISREKVTSLRLQLGIPDSRERRRELLERDAANILKSHRDISVRGLTALLQQQGYDIGKYAVGKLKEELFKDMPIAEKQINSEPLEESIEISEKENIFSRLIGFDGSLKNQITRAQAAVLYPPKGLHTLIYGPSGVGKSYLAELMHRYAVNTENFADNAPYFEFNCADYADNPQLLMAQLFGYVKGAFTGANENKKGIAELCDGGILFLDEVHRLSAEGQEMLFYLMDKGRVRRLGEVDSERKINVMIIAATTENPESSLLLTFRRRIPMIIELSPIKSRPLNEVLQFIRTYFASESQRLGRVLRVKQQVMTSLMTSEYQGNVGQMKSDIQVCCAKAFLEMKLNSTGEIVVRLENLPESMRSSTKGYHSHKEAAILIKGDELFTPDNNYEYEEKHNKKSSSIYVKLETRYQELLDQGIEKEEINKLISKEVEESLLKQIQEVEDSKISLQEASNIVGEAIVAITREIYENAKRLLPGLKSSVILPLSLHITMAIDRYRKYYKSSKSSLSLDIEEYGLELQAATEALELMNKKYFIKLPKEEISFLSMYFHNFQGKPEVKGRAISLLVVSHGRVASGMAEVANTLMGVDHALGLDMDFKDSPETMINRVIRTVKDIDQGLGCIILADMGSLVTMKDRVARETGVPIGLVGRTDTVMVMDALRKVLWTHDSLDKIVQDLEPSGRYVRGDSEQGKEKPEVILCLCVTGEGAAKKIKEELQRRLNSIIGDISILTRGYIENQRVEDMVQELEREYRLLAIVGTIDPEVSRYPFYSFIDILGGTGIKGLRRLIKRNALNRENNLGEVISEEGIYVNTGFTYKDEVLDNAISQMVQRGEVKEEFLLSVYKREGLMTTFLKGGIAIPHGDTQLVTKTAISVTKLDNPIVWDGINTVDIVFVLALREDAKNYFEKLYEIISDEMMISALRGCESKEEILKLLCKNT